MEQSNSRVFNCCEHEKIKNHCVDCHISVDLCILLWQFFFLNKAKFVNCNWNPTDLFIKYWSKPFYFAIIIWMSAFLVIWNTCFPKGLADRKQQNAIL